MQLNLTELTTEQLWKLQDAIEKELGRRQLHYAIGTAADIATRQDWADQFYKMRVTDPLARKQAIEAEQAAEAAARASYRPDTRTPQERVKQQQAQVWGIDISKL